MGHIVPSYPRIVPYNWQERVFNGQASVAQALTFYTPNNIQPIQQLNNFRFISVSFVTFTQYMNFDKVFPLSQSFAMINLVVNVRKDPLWLQILSPCES